MLYLKSVRRPAMFLHLSEQSQSVVGEKRTRARSGSRNDVRDAPFAREVVYFKALYAIQKLREIWKQLLDLPYIPRQQSIQEKWPPRWEERY